MNDLQEKPIPTETQPEVTTEPKPVKEARPKEAPQQKPLPWLHDLDFWRFVLAALSLAWEIAKTFVR